MKILIIDDSYEFTESLSDLLAKRGHKIQIINNVDQILGDLTIVENFDFITLDVMMKLSSEYPMEQSIDAGVILFKKIREFSDIPVIMISAMNYSAIRDKISLYKNLFYFAKPLAQDMTEIFEIVENKNNFA
jgi:CheY-like chemotaxis protein